VDIIRILIVDDHPVVRAGIKTMLSKEQDIRVVGELSVGGQVLQAVQELSPDVLLLDINMPGFNAVTTTEQLKKLYPKTKILILTAYDDDEYVFGLLSVGATGYVLKDEALETLVSAVRATAKGEPWLTQKVAGRLMREAIKPRKGAGETKGIPLSSRELEVLILMAQGASNDDIAAKLFISKRTVQNHVASIYRKLELESRPEAILYALRHNLVDLNRQ
jgi:DNA-binding NarL/FixJ family response regulator